MTDHSVPGHTLPAPSYLLSFIELCQFPCGSDKHRLKSVGEMSLCSDLKHYNCLAPAVLKTTDSLFRGVSAIQACTSLYIRGSISDWHGAHCAEPRFFLFYSVTAPSLKHCLTIVCIMSIFPQIRTCSIEY